MSLDDLKNKILTDAKKEAEEIKNHARTEAEKIRQQAVQELERLRTEAQKEADRLAEEKYRNIITSARINARNRILETKQKVLNRVFEQAHEQLQQMDEQKFKTLVENLLKQFPPKEDVEVYVGSRHKGMTDAGFIRRISRQLNAPGKFVLAGEDSPLEDGLYLKSGKIEINLSFGNLLKSLREQMELELINVLFK